MTSLPAEHVHVLDRNRVRREQEGDRPGGSARESAGEPEDRKRAQEAPGVDFEIRNHDLETVDGRR